MDEDPCRGPTVGIYPNAAEAALLERVEQRDRVPNKTGVVVGVRRG